MDTVTYPDATVQRMLGEHAVAARFNTHEPDDQVKQLMRRFRQVWTPTLIFLDHHGIELRRQVGFLPPVDFVAEVGLALGMAHLMHARFDEAFKQFRLVRERHAGQEAAAEALYWAGVAALRRNGSADGLLTQWKELKAEYPNSTWWTKASFIDS